MEARFILATSISMIDGDKKKAPGKALFSYSSGGGCEIRRQMIKVIKNQ